jgi:peptidoglycan hydrolase-like protein with peptidoglycan-binding domain
MKLIRQGMRGPTVKAVQVLVNAATPGGQSLDKDGIFGPLTAQGVALFQTKAGLLADGIVGPNTTRALLQRVPKS